MPMPGMKALKGIGRRKSGTPGLDDGAQVPSSSFRVIPRDEANRKSVGGALDKPLPVVTEYRRTWSEEDTNSSNRGSGSSAATSARSRAFDRTSATNHSSPFSQSPNDSSKMTPTLARAQTQPTLGYLDVSPDTEDDDFSDLFKGFADRRSIVVDTSFGKPPVVVRTESEPFLAKPDPAWRRLAKTPPPVALKRSPDPSPYSRKSRNSNDGLLNSPASDDSPVQDYARPPQSKPGGLIGGLGFLSFGDKANKDDSSPGFLRRMASSESFLRSGNGEDADAKMVRNSVLAVRQSNGQSTNSTGSPVSHADRKDKSLRPPGASPGASSSDISMKTPSMSSDSSLGTSSRSSNLIASNDTTPRARKAVPAYLDDDDDDEPLFDPSMMSAIRAVGSKSPLAQNPAVTEEKKVLTAAQFEDLKKRSAYEKSKGVAADSDSGEEYEDDDDDDRKIAEAKKRQEQKDAQHIIWRQKMAKDIGDHSSQLHPRPDMKRQSQSAPNLLLGLPPSMLRTVSESGSKDSSDEDDIPLGILQAHNFPQRGKTPDPRLSQHSFIGTSGRPASTMFPGPSAQRGSLPPFARKLPQDPHVSTNDLLGPGSRESMQFNRQSTLYPPPGLSPVPNIPPGGLVGVIAEEERQKAIRRGSPNPQMQSMSPGMSMGMQGMPMNVPGLGQGIGSMGGVGAMGMGGGMMPGAQMMAPPQQGQGQAEINQQLLQVVQQQNLMMQAMMAQMQGGMQPQMGGMGMNMQGGGFMNQQQPQSLGQMRPASIISGSGQRTASQARMSMVNLQRPAQPRTMSMVSGTSPYAGWGTLAPAAQSVRNMHMGPGPGYTPSVAPSERSNIGQPSRYRPVTNSHFGDGGSTITSLSTPQLLNQTELTDPVKKKKSGFFSAMIHPKGHKTAGVAADDEEDEWSSFAKKRLSVLPSRVG